MSHVLSTEAGRRAVQTLADKDLELTRFQQAHGISDRIADRAIKEWVLSHNGDFNWDLEDVKQICLRLK